MTAGLMCFRCGVWPCVCSDGITLVHGDCREVLPQLEPVDLVLTDPPYGVGKDYASHDDTPENLLPLIDCLAGYPQRLITCGIGNIWKYPEADWVICWYKSNCMTRSKVANANKWEPVLVYGCNGFGADGVDIPIVPQNNGHPCPKPLKLFKWLLARAKPEPAIVCDPFAGSGTTLVAAKQLGRRCIGIEIEKRYCEIACERLRQSVLNFKD